MKRAVIRLRMAPIPRNDEQGLWPSNWMIFESEEAVVDYLVGLIQAETLTTHLVCDACRRYFFNAAKYRDYPLDIPALWQRAKLKYLVPFQKKADDVIAALTLPARFSPKVRPPPRKRRPKGGDLGGASEHGGGLGDTGRRGPGWPAAFCNSGEPRLPLVPGGTGDFPDARVAPHPRAPRNKAH